MAAIRDKVITSLASATHAGGRYRLEVHVFEASSLRTVQLLGRQDPYVRLDINGSKYIKAKTRVAEDGGSFPRWNQHLVLYCDAPRDALHITVKDKNWAMLGGAIGSMMGTKKDRVIGKAIIPIASILAAPMDTWIPLDGGMSGSIHLSLRVSAVDAVAGMPYTSMPAPVAYPAAPMMGAPMMAAPAPALAYPAAAPMYPVAAAPVYPVAAAPAYPAAMYPAVAYPAAPGYPAYPGYYTY